MSEEVQVVRWRQF